MTKARAVVHQLPRCDGKHLFDVFNGDGVARSTRIVHCYDDGTEECVNYAGVIIHLCRKCKARYRKIGMIAQ